MNKIQMAHDMALVMAANGDVPNENIVAIVWQYADAMQAEADEREDKTRPKALLTKDKDGKCLHFNHEFGHKNCMDCGASLEEWQPDWSQAPDTATHWTMRQDGECLWWKGKPLFDGSCFYDAVGICHTVGYAPSFNYQGNWQDSLRKHPEALFEVDWSQAPEWANWWAMDKNLEARWILSETGDPYIGICNKKWFSMGKFNSNLAPSFGYTGNWKNSPRKRPQ